MKDIRIYCEDSDCVCEDVCCQDCEQRTVCDRKCSTIRWKEKIYSSDEFLVEELYDLADRMENWLIAVAAERIRDLIKAQEYKS